MERFFLAFIKCGRNVVQWVGEMVDQARRETNLLAFVRSTDDGNQLIIIKGRSNAQGTFLKILEILRNGKEFMIIVPDGKEGSGWENFSYTL